MDEHECVYWLDEHEHERAGTLDVEWELTESCRSDKSSSGWMRIRDWLLGRARKLGLVCCFSFQSSLCGADKRLCVSQHREYQGASCRRGCAILSRAVQDFSRAGRTVAKHHLHLGYISHAIPPASHSHPLRLQTTNTKSCTSWLSPRKQRIYGTEHSAPCMCSGAASCVGLFPRLGYGNGIIGVGRI